jgi:hypothetical protein
MSAMPMTTRLPITSAVRCARCGHSMSSAIWRALPTERTLTSADLGGHILAWPTDAVVEVRRCAGCDAPIARRARAL